MLREKFSPEALCGVYSEVFVQLIAHHVFFIGKYLNDIKLSNFLNVLKVLLDKVLFDFYFPPEYCELIVKRGITVLTIHKFKNGFELVLKFALLDESVDYAEVYVFGKFQYSIVKHQRQEFVSLPLEIFEVLRVVLNFMLFSLKKVHHDHHGFREA